MTATDKPTPPAAPGRLLHPIADVCATLGDLSKATFYREVARGRIKTVKIGVRTFVVDDELRRYVQTLADDAAKLGRPA